MITSNYELMSIGRRFSCLPGVPCRRNLSPRPKRAKSPAAPPPHFKTPAFEGPLDLLLHLIRANQVDIYDIPDRGNHAAVSRLHGIVGGAGSDRGGRVRGDCGHPDRDQVAPAAAAGEAGKPGRGAGRPPRRTGGSGCWNISSIRARWKPCADGRSCGGRSIFAARWKTRTITYCPCRRARRTPRNCIRRCIGCWQKRA